MYIHIYVYILYSIFIHYAICICVMYVFLFQKAVYITITVNTIYTGRPRNHYGELISRIDILDKVENRSSHLISWKDFTAAVCLLGTDEDSEHTVQEVYIYILHEYMNRFYVSKNTLYAYSN
jgi:hypothetical protein